MPPFDDESIHRAPATTAASTGRPAPLLLLRSPFALPGGGDDRLDVLFGEVEAPAFLDPEVRAHALLVGRDACLLSDLAGAADRAAVMTTTSSATSTFFVIEGVETAREAVQAIFPYPSFVNRTAASFVSCPAFDAPAQAKMIRFVPPSGSIPDSQAHRGVFCSVISLLSKQYLFDILDAGDVADDLGPPST